MPQDRDTPIIATGYTNPRCIHAQADSVPGVTGRAVAIVDHEPERLSVAEVHDQVGCPPRAKSLSAGGIPRWLRRNVYSGIADWSRALAILHFPRWSRHPTEIDAT
jgi:hypothetical protein